MDAAEGGTQPTHSKNEAAQYSPPLVQTTPIVSSYKIQRPCFSKWDGAPTTKPLFPAKLLTYNSKS